MTANTPSISPFSGRRHRAGGDGACAGILRRIGRHEPGCALPQRGACGRRPLQVTPARRCRRRPSSCASRRMPSCSAPAGCPIRYPDNTEIMPQVDLRFIFDLYAGVRPCRLVAERPEPDRRRARARHRFHLIRESTEGLFASMGKGMVTQDEARETLVITRKTSQRLFDFSLPPGRAAKDARRPGLLTCVDKANAFKAYAFFRKMFDERAKSFPEREDRPRSMLTPAPPCWCASRGTST